VVVGNGIRRREGTAELKDRGIDNGMHCARRRIVVDKRCLGGKNSTWDLKAYLLFVTALAADTCHSASVYAVVPYNAMPSHCSINSVQCHRDFSLLHLLAQHYSL
jgi:hypothetical protein